MGTSRGWRGGSGDRLERQNDLADAAHHVWNTPCGEEEFVTVLISTGEEASRRALEVVVQARAGAAIC